MTRYKSIQPEEMDTHKITQIIVGESLQRSSFLSFLKPSIPYQIFKKTHGVDVSIIATHR
ncbi:MAG: hypothetical protein K2X66_17000 [Cyanobacteria bacterium]|nr:hypothetical protein [Cyanobacteriota bacterium]